MDASHASGNSRRVRASRIARRALAAFALACGVALAQTPLATSPAPDRLQLLIDGARKEREVVIYTSTPVDDMKALTDRFEAQYGIATKVWRASSEKVRHRVLAEARSGRVEADIVETNGPELESLVRERVLQPVRSSAHGELIPEALLPHEAWVGTRLVVFVLAYNTRLVRKEDLPAQWEGFADPKWKGRLGVESDDVDWLATVVDDLGGETRGVGIFREIVRRNGISVRKGHTLLAQLVASGEVPLAFTVYNYKVEQLKARGAPIDWFVIGKAIARANGIAVTARPKNPHAALLFHEFAISAQGQRILAEREFIPTHRGIGSRLNVPLRFIDPAATLDEYPKWRKLYDDTFIRRPD